MIFLCMALCLWVTCGYERRWGGEKKGEGQGVREITGPCADVPENEKLKMNMSSDFFHCQGCFSNFQMIVLLHILVRRWISSISSYFRKILVLSQGLQLQYTINVQTWQSYMIFRSPIFNSVESVRHEHRRLTSPQKESGAAFPLSLSFHLPP